MECRPFRDGDAEQAAALLNVLSPGTVQTAAFLRHRQVREPQRARRASWVAVEDGELVGLATALLQWFGGEAGKGRLWVGVRADRRRRGIGSALWRLATAHLHGARKLTVEVDDDPAGLDYVRRRGFTQYDSEVIMRLDLRAATLVSRDCEGFRVVRLAEVHMREPDLFDFFVAAGAIPPSDPVNRVTLPEWRRFVLESPLLDPEASVVVLDGNDRVVSLSWLLVDPATARAESEWTATLPALRGRGLARLAKVAALRLAAERGVREALTGNHPDNLPMRDLNRRLGYVELYLRRDLEAPA